MTDMLMLLEHFGNIKNIGEEHYKNGWLVKAIGNWSPPHVGDMGRFAWNGLKTFCTLWHVFVTLFRTSVFIDMFLNFFCFFLITALFGFIFHGYYFNHKTTTKFCVIFRGCTGCKEVPKWALVLIFPIHRNNWETVLVYLAKLPSANRTEGLQQRCYCFLQCKGILIILSYFYSHVLDSNVNLSF